MSDPKTKQCDSLFFQWHIKNLPKFLCLAFSILLCLTAGHAWGVFSIVRSGVPSCSIVIPETPTTQEEFAVEELNHFVEKFTGRRLEKRADSEPLPDGNVILIGTPESNKYIGELHSRDLILWREDSNDDKFALKLVRDRGRDYLMILGGRSRGVIYGVYALVEKIIEDITDLNPVDLDFHVNPVSSLAVGTLNVRSEPFYPIRCALSQEEPEWMSRHRINVSGAEGIWSGTGIDDGLGTALKYVDEEGFDDMQDETLSQRWKRISSLRARLRRLRKGGIDPYLFMYVMGEPTKAIMKNHPELLEDMVHYPSARNGYGYRPISWTRAEARQLIRELVKSIVETYYPWLTGFHLRSWGWETRAPAGKDEEQQELLWEIYFDIMEAAREVDPDFRFIISGYDQFWLKDPDRVYAARLPQGTLLMHKWGVDGEPTNDPGIEVEYINSIARSGQRILIFSHDTEEVMPLWMLEADLFVEGVRKYADNPNVNGLGGFTLQGGDGLTHLDRLVSARMGWDPYVDHVALMRNYLINYYGSQAAQHILEALRINSLVMADYFSDYAGSLSLDGRYGQGSRSYATRFWDIIGQEAVEDALAIPDLEMAVYAKERVASLLPRQQAAANEIMEARKLVQPVSDQSERDYSDNLHLMRMWVRFFESRLRLVEAREMGLRGGSYEQITQKLSSAMEYSREMQSEIAEINSFTNIFEYDNHLAKESLITTIDEEIDYMRNFDPSEIVVAKEHDEGTGSASLAITDLINHPNPMNDRATFCYNLTSDADEVTVSIYTVRGRRVRVIAGASSRAGYNEESWEAVDEDGRKLASGTYIFRVVATQGSKKVRQTGKLSIVR